MRRYKMQDRSGNVVYRTDTNLSLQAVEHMTDWSEDEFDMIASMQVGESYCPHGVYVERTA